MRDLLSLFITDYNLNRASTKFLQLVVAIYKGVSNGPCEHLQAFTSMRALCFILRA